MSYYVILCCLCSQDDRINGVCGVSRLLGCYYLHPQIIPLPDTRSYSLPSNSSYLILASHGLWKFVTHREILRMVHSVRDPAYCSRRLAEIAIANGCPLDVSVVAVKLNLNPRHSRGAGLEEATARKSWSGVSLESDNDSSDNETESESEDATINDGTNIDDYLQDQFMDEDVVSPAQDKTHLESEGLRVISPEQLDALVMTGAGSDTRLTEDLSTGSSESDMIKRGSYIDLEEAEGGMLGAYEDHRMSSSSDDQFEYILQESRQEQPLEEQSLEEHPEDNSPEEEDEEESPPVQVKSKNGTMPRKEKKKLDFAVTETQSMKNPDSIDNSPAVQVKSLAKSHPALGQLNRAMSNLKDEDDEDGINWDASMGAKVKRKKSFVESAYSRISKSYPTDAT